MCIRDRRCLPGLGSACLADIGSACLAGLGSGRTFGVSNTSCTSGEVRERTMTGASPTKRSFLPGGAVSSVSGLLS